MNKFRFFVFLFVFFVLVVGGAGLASASVDFNSLNSATVAYYTFDENTGTTAFDSTPNEYDGTITGATWTTGKINSGLSFDSGQYVRFEDEDLKGLSSFSISLWIKPEILNNNNANIITNWQTSGNQRGYIFSLNQGRPQVLLSDDGTFNGDYTTISSNTISNNKYYHLVMTFSGGTATRIYVDGVLDGENTANVPNSIFSPNELVQINGRQTRDYVNGNIDEVAIFDRALTSDEVSFLYAEGSPGEAQQYPFSDGGIITGTVKIGTTNVEGAKIRLINQTTGTIISDTLSSSTGAYEFTELIEDNPYHLTVEYEEGDPVVKYNAKSLWDVLPKEEE